ncbi:hypothetical protein [Paenibacillus piri]|uniref:Uncharacterized protein n=1 Tax=Paenibacillus piri TaxID=2547395 RepID=A0A4R5KW37_9BACL|nr:hypothetical protein [Paenibacillus piri]TDG00204.1 hypothetical protein E1757_00745 [Paenibacillus piri]
MVKKLFANSAVRLTLAVSLLFGGALTVSAGTTHADSMGCYGWFDYVYKSTGDVNFAYYHFLVCRGEAVAQKITKYEPDANVLKTLEPDSLIAPLPRDLVLSP